MKIFKSGESSLGSLAIEGELSVVNAFAKREMTAEELYLFSVVLCDNEVDRDFERFSDEALEEMSLLFVGRTGIFDHEWKAENQTARIYRTELVRQEGVYNSLGEPYALLKGFAYMLRNEKNAPLIAEVEAGIKKETSIGCSVGTRVCSICGQEHGADHCGHIHGREYEGKVCFVTISEVTDAYEWSFVAVPAQRAAGVVKGFGRADRLKDFLRREAGGKFFAEFEILEKEAALGREYQDTLRREVLRLSLLCDPKLHEALEGGTRHMGAAELLSMKAAFDEQLAKRFPPKTQLPGRDAAVSFDGAEYIV